MEQTAQDEEEVAVPPVKRRGRQATARGKRAVKLETESDAQDAPTPEEAAVKQEAPEPSPQQLPKRSRSKQAATGSSSSLLFVHVSVRVHR